MSGTIDARDAQLAALFDPEALVGAVERDHVAAGRVVRRQRLFSVRVAARDDAFDRHGGAVHRAVAHQPFAHNVVDRLAQPVARGHQPGVGAFLRRQREPARGDGAGEVVGLHLGDVAAEPVEGPRDVAREARLDRFLQGRVALAHDLVYDGGLHAGGLELRKGLAGVHGVELLLVADQHQAGTVIPRC